jgi:predicted RNase H-like HicB family nuclease
VSERRSTVVTMLDPGGDHTVRIPVLPNWFTEGDTFDEARTNVRDVITLIVTELEARGVPMPEKGSPCSRPASPSSDGSPATGARIEATHDRAMH